MTLFITPFVRNICEHIKRLNIKWIRFDDNRVLFISDLDVEIWDLSSGWLTFYLEENGNEYPLSLIERIYIWESIKYIVKKYKKIHDLNSESFNYEL